MSNNNKDAKISGEFKFKLNKDSKSTPEPPPPPPKKDSVPVTRAISKAIKYKDMGNDSFKKESYEEAMRHYNEGITALKECSKL